MVKECEAMDNMPPSPPDLHPHCEEKQSGVDEFRRRSGQKVTVQPTRSPAQEERPFVELQELRACREGFWHSFGMKASTTMTALNSPAAIKVGSNSVDGESMGRVQKDGYNLPSHDALAEILPNYQTLFKREKTDLQQEEEGPAERPEAPQANKPKISHKYQAHRPHKPPPLHDFEDDPHVDKISNLQAKEVDNYRSAMSKMAEDIIVLRTQILKLEAENRQLRTDLSLHQDLGRDLLDDADVDVMAKAEMADRISSLKFKLASETSKAASQMDTIQQLQNDLIQKHKSEEEQLNLQTLQQQQHADLKLHQSCLAKMAKLETKVKQQEKIIEKMEKALDSKLAVKSKQRGDKKPLAKKPRGETEQRKEEMDSTLAVENGRLREEFPNVAQPPVQQTKAALQVKERLSLLSQLELAEVRVQTLEAQLKENCKLWGTQKQDMLTKLSEHKHGFMPTPATVLQNVALVSRVA
ncbi:coiled-coil domain-containing protein 33 [Brachionichthys hirsutus]|uniref:coiled-coil domain-containing protein 33 n=1 Tax=Brachionichthys hirsutus TaxID=412623 RepID=UPI003604B833